MKSLIVALSEVAYQTTLNPNKPILVDARKGEKQVKKRFDNMDDYKKWASSKEAESFKIDYVYQA